jgi:O-glycosyl hydrolase
MSSQGSTGSKAPIASAAATGTSKGPPVLQTVVCAFALLVFAGVDCGNPSPERRDSAPPDRQSQPGTGGAGGDVGNGDGGAIGTGGTGSGGIRVSGGSSAGGSSPGGIATGGIVSGGIAAGGRGAGGVATGGSSVGGGSTGGSGAGAIAAGGSATGGIGGRASGGTGAGGGGAPGSGGAISYGGGSSNPNSNVKATQSMQLMDGFGVSNAWLYAPDASIKSTVYDALFSLTKGAGLSILRNRMPFRENPKMDDKFINKNTDGTYSSTSSASGGKTFALNWGNWDVSNTSTLISDIKSKGADYQVTKFLSTPWTPPNNSVSKWKLSDSNKTIDYTNTPEQGGYLDPNHYSDYADVLADYVLGFKAKMGVDLTAMSLQNEPNFQCTYESADWSAAQFHDFFGVLKTEFTKKGVFTQLPALQIMAPEFQNVKEDLILPTLADSNVAGLLGIVGVHQYEFGKANVGSYQPPVLTNSVSGGKPIWMTEFSTAAWGNDSSITDGLIVARLVHMDLTTAGMSAFLYWWAWGNGNGYLVTVNGTSVSVPKRLYAIGQFSRFVRPGWHRVSTTASPATNVYLSAFKDPTGGQIAVVAINAGTSQASLPLTIDAGKFGTLTVYRTSATESIANVGTLTGGATVTATLPASSVTTLVGAITP